METQNKSFFQNPSTQITLKLALIVILVLFLLIPKVLIMELVEERRQLSQSVIDEVSSGWSNDQIITGPVLVIPYHEMVPQADLTKPNITVKKNLLIYPEILDTEGTIDTESKYRSLYKVLLYRSSMDIKGSFVIPDHNLINISQQDLLYQEAYIAVGITDPKGIENNIDFKWSDQPFSLSPGMVDVHFKLEENNTPDRRLNYELPDGNYNRGFKTGLHTKIPVTAERNNYTFSYNLDIKGSKSLMFAPIAKATSVHLSSSFADPVFSGGFLPEHKTDSKGFDARWNILEYNKTLPPFQKEVSEIDLGKNVFGVKIQQMIDNYTTTYRAVKYMILFVALTFLVVFLTEIVQRLRIHIFQYTLIGLALAIFFTLLLSISEFWGFDRAYISAATATIGLIYLYSLGMFRSSKSSLTLLGLLVGLFGYIYLIIQLEKMALLAGSLGLFVIIAATMYVTRKIKWFEGGETF
ncbi:MAG: cell envelope integrity protein CreD [Saprospiraceae bacterium]|nr:cell envelope integrity protein CreD [Saprospiraceae bacterium]